MPAGQATAAVLVYRAISYWLPVLGGWGVFMWGRRQVALTGPPSWSGMIGE